MRVEVTGSRVDILTIFGPALLRGESLFIAAGITDSVKALSFRAVDLRQTELDCEKHPD
jgi:hypothetical protein